MSGYGVAGLAGGFGSGLANVLMKSRQDIREQDRIAEDRKLREFAMIFPQVMQMDTEYGDFSRSEDLLNTYLPDVAKQFKKESPFQYLGPLLKPNAADVNAGQGQALQSQPTTPEQQMALPGAPSSIDVPAPTPIQPTRVAGVQPAPATFLGHPILTPQQRLERRTQEAQAELEGRNQATLSLNKQEVQQRLQQARDLNLDPSSTIRFALTGQMPREDLTQTDAENFNAQIARFTAEHGRPPTMDEVNQMRQEWYKHGSNHVANLGSFEDYVGRFAAAKGKKPEDLTAADIEAARRAYGRADDAAQRVPVPIIFQGPNGAMIADRVAGTARPVTDATTGTPVGRNPSAAERKDLGELQTIADRIGAVQAAYKPELVGPLAGRYGEYAQQIPGITVPPGYTDLASKLAQVQNAIIYARSGKQINEQEFKRLQKELPLMTDKPEVFPTKLKNTISLLETLASNRKSTMGVGGGTGTTTPAGGTFSVIYQGKPYTFDSQAKLDLFKRQFGIP